jgi:hypothetical protein
MDMAIVLAFQPRQNYWISKSQMGIVGYFSSLEIENLCVTFLHGRVASIPETRHWCGRVPKKSQ